MLIDIMDKKNINTAIVFADIAGSSKLYKRLGDHKANAAISQCVAMMVREVIGHQGFVVKTIGDEVMARFTSAAQACAAGSAMQLNCYNDPDGLNIRIGAAYGSTILNNNDVFGEVVNDAAAIAKVAKAHQFLISQVFADELSNSGKEFNIHRFDKIAMKGSQLTTVIHRVDWEPQDITLNATQVIDIGTMQLQMVAPHIELEYLLRGDIVESHSVTSKTTPFSVGRETKSCSLGVPTTFASRDHFDIDYRRGKYIVKDHSTNGTYVKEDGAELVYLRREEMPLRGNGVISMGQLPEEADHLLYFKSPVTKSA